jgi:hypothetical protein
MKRAYANRAHSRKRVGQERRTQAHAKALEFLVRDQRAGSTPDVA